MHRNVSSVLQNLKCSRRRNVVKSSPATDPVTSEYFLDLCFEFIFAVVRVDLIIALHEWEIVYCVHVRHAYSKIKYSTIGRFLGSVRCGDKNRTVSIEDGVL